MLALNVDHIGETEKGQKLNIGDIVEYKGHLPGGNVSIILADGTKDIAHPFCFKEFK